MAGSVAGTERWIVCLRNRGFSLRQELQNIRLATAANRPALIAALRTRAQTDQAGIAQAVVAAGGGVQRHYWHLSALAVEIPPAAVAALRQVPRVGSLWPVRGRPSSDVGAVVAATRGADFILSAPVPPQAATVDGVNHNVQAAWTILGSAQNPYRGAGARVAVFDSGIDVDTHDTNGVANLHPAFLVAGSTTQSRVVANLRAGAAVHSIAVGATDAFGMESFAFGIQPNVVHLELGLQAALFPGSGGQLLTNALRVRVGGGL